MRLAVDGGADLDDRQLLHHLIEALKDRVLRGEHLVQFLCHGVLSRLAAAGGTARPARTGLLDVSSPARLLLRQIETRRQGTGSQRADRIDHSGSDGSLEKGKNDLHHRSSTLYD